MVKWMKQKWWGWHQLIHIVIQNIKHNIIYNNLNELGERTSRHFKMEDKLSLAEWLNIDMDTTAHQLDSHWLSNAKSLVLPGKMWTLYLDNTLKENSLTSPWSTIKRINENLPLPLRSTVHTHKLGCNGETPVQSNRDKEGYTSQTHPQLDTNQCKPCTTTIIPN